MSLTDFYMEYLSHGVDIAASDKTAVVPIELVNL